MIKLDISIAIFLYLVLSGVTILLLWVFYGYKKNRIIFKKDIEYMWKCSICTNIYIDSKDERISKCPQCGFLNKRGN